MSKMVAIDAMTVKLLHRPNYLITVANGSKRKAGMGGNAVQALPRLVRPLKKLCLVQNRMTILFKFCQILDQREQSKN